MKSIYIIHLSKKKKKRYKSRWLFTLYQNDFEILNSTHSFLLCLGNKHVNTHRFENYSRKKSGKRAHTNDSKIMAREIRQKKYKNEWKKEIRRKNKIKANVEKSVIWINRLFRFGKLKKDNNHNNNNSSKQRQINKSRYICRHSLRFYAHLSLWPSNSRIDRERERERRLAFCHARDPLKYA